MLLYSGVINILSGLLDALGPLVPKDKPRKFFRFVRGQRHVIRHIRETYVHDPSRPTVWLHAASFGEFAIARPLIHEMRGRGARIVMTFFSPTGYEALEHNHPEIDYLYYLPFDTRRNAKAFIDIIRPDKAVFLVSEYWFNYLDLLRRRGVDTYLVSAKITDKSIFFKWYGGLYRRCLDSYKHIFAIDETSVSNLARLGCNTAEVCGNPLFDNAIQKARTQWRDEVVERFAARRGVCIAGSIHDEHDLQMVTDIANRHPDVKFLMVPHETGDKSTRALKEALHGRALAYSECTAETDFGDVQSLIIDYVGALAYIYRYADWAYVGGGFTPYLHSLVEATVYGLPVAFGPMIYRKITPAEIVDKGIGAIVNNSDELDALFCKVKDDPDKMAEIRAKAKAYVKANAGSTHKIVKIIMG